MASLAKDGMIGHVGLVLRGKWKLTQYLARGACAEVWAVSCDEATAKYEGRDSANGFVAKLCAEPPFLSAAQKKKRRKATEEELVATTLAWEHTLYHGILRDHPSVPATPVRMDYGDSDGVRFLVMERLGTNLLDLFRSTGCSFTNAKLAQYGEAMLDAVRECHSRKILYVDVKPDNFMLGLSGKNAGKVVIADFGVAEKFIDSKGAHRLEGSSGAAGTPQYQSLHVHGGGTPSRRDDLEALGFVLLEFALKGKSLPWGGASSHQAGLQAKQAADVAQLLGGSRNGAASHPVAAWVALARGTAFAAEPDYAAFAALLRDLAAMPDSSTSGASTVAPTAAAGKASAKRGGKKAAKEKAAPSKSVDLAGAADDEVVEEAAPDVGPHGTVIKSPKAKKQKKAEAAVEPKKKSPAKKGATSSSSSKTPKAVASSPPSPVVKLSSPTTRSVSASASASASVTYTYRARQPLGKGDRRVNAGKEAQDDDHPKGRGRSKKRRSEGVDEDVDDNGEVSTYEATVTVNASARSTRRLASLSP